jgi:hypothetical protein
MKTPRPNEQLLPPFDKVEHGARGEARHWSTPARRWLSVPVLILCGMFGESNVGASDYRQVGNSIVDVSKIIEWEARQKQVGNSIAGKRPHTDWIHVQSTVRDNVNGRVGVAHLLPGTKVSMLWVRQPPNFPITIGTKVDWWVRTGMQVWSIGYDSFAMECDYGIPVTAAQYRALISPPAPSFGAGWRFTTNYVVDSFHKEAAGKKVAAANCQSINGEVLRVLSPGIVEVELYRQRVTWTGPMVDKGGGALGRRDRNVEQVNGPHVIVLDVGDRAVGRKVEIRAYEIGTTNLGSGMVLPLYAMVGPWRDAVVTSNLIYSAEEISQAKLQMRSRVVAYQHQQASNGFGSFQYEIGKRYLNGDGVPVDAELARHWLRSACTNGLSEATNLLAKVPAPELTTAK